MGGFCCCQRKTTDLPQRYTESRSCTDIVFTFLFIVFLALFVVLGAIAFRSGDLKSIIRGNDYLGYVCGEGEGPPGFESLIPSNAEFQSRKWSDNKYVWYPLPLVKSVSELLDVNKYMNLGVCVSTCPKTDVEILKGLLEGNIAGLDMNKFTIYAYGNETADHTTVNPASLMHVVYDTSLLYYRCLPSLKQPDLVRESISSPVVNKVYSFAMHSVVEIENSWRVLVIEAVIAIVLGLIFVFMLRFLISIMVWLMLILVFFILAGIGGICFFLYYTKGQNNLLKASIAQNYPTLLLVLSIVFWLAALLYAFFILAISKKVRFVCAIIKISGRVLSSAPFTLFIPIITCILIIALMAWSLLIALSLYSANEKGVAYSLVPITKALQYNGTKKISVGGEDIFNVSTRVLNSPQAYEYMVLADLFGFLWTTGFCGAFCFTSISFIAVFWYFSDYDDTRKEVPPLGVCRGIWWTLFYHSGTLALGSLLIAIVQTLRMLLTYFAKKAQTASGNDHLIKCLVCYAQCFLACFERVLSVVNRNAYSMMCLTSECFCFSACRAVSLMLSYAVELLFLSWVIEVVIFIGKAFIIGICCISAYFLLDVEGLAPDVKLKIAPIILVSLMAYFLGCAFFNVYGSCSAALLVCYCYDRQVNASRGQYYVPEELEHQIDDYSQREKTIQLNEQQAALHRS